MIIAYQLFCVCDQIEGPNSCVHPRIIHGFMSPLTYKVFNLYSFIRCGTYNSHLYTTTILILNNIVIINICEF